jgi:hypothetical protein
MDAQPKTEHSRNRDAPEDVPSGIPCLIGVTRYLSASQRHPL